MPGLKLAGKVVSTTQKLEDSIFGKFIDHDGEMKLDLEEFVEMMPERIREIHDRQTICSWYTTADENGDGKLSINEFFHWSLCSSKVNGAAILEEAFKLYDTEAPARSTSASSSRWPSTSASGTWRARPLRSWTTTGAA